MDFASNYEICRTADFVRTRNFTRVALQVTPLKTHPFSLPSQNPKLGFWLLDNPLRALKVSIFSQFPDELLKDSTRVAKALKNELGKGVRLFVMADTAYGSCCVDEIAASHVDAECVVHYGHACMSPWVQIIFGWFLWFYEFLVLILERCRTSTLPALFVFGKAEIDVNNCAECLARQLSTSGKPVLVWFKMHFCLEFG